MRNPLASISRLRRHAFWLLAAAQLTAVLCLGVPAASAQTPAPATIQVTFSPDTFQPDTWTVIESVTVITNTGEDDIEGAHLDIGSVNGPLPTYLWVSLVVDGAYVPVGPGDLCFEVPLLEPGQSSTSHLIILLKMSHGTWSGVDTVSTADDQELARVDLQLTASPSQDLLVTKTLVEGPSGDGTSTSTDVFETKVTNHTSSTITDLTLIDRTDYVDLVDSEPSPVTQDADPSLATWDLASFGKDSLAPGESLVLRLTYRLSEESGCSLSSSGVVVEARVDGRFERIGTRPDEEYVGPCYFIGDSAGGAGEVIPAQTGSGDLPSGFGRGGEGPSDSTFDLLWAVTFLAAGGTTLVGLATLARRRVRR